MAVDFRAKQAEFAAYIRDPLHHPAPADVDPQRMAMYRELFFNNIDSFLSTSFPVLRTLFDATQWQALAADFFARHRCQTPYFSEIAEEFLDYLQQGQNVADYPFLWELAHYEWVELALAIARETPVFADPASEWDWQQQAVVLSPLAWPLLYRFPVQQIAVNFIPDQPPPQPTCLVVYRDREHDVHFMAIASLTLRLLQLLDADPQTAPALVARLALELPGSEAETLLPHAIVTLREMLDRGIVIPATQLIFSTEQR